MNSSEVKLGTLVKKTFLSLFYPQILILFFLPFLLSLVFVFTALWLSWGWWVYNGRQVLSLFEPSLPYVMQFVPQFVIPYFQAMSPVLYFVLFIFLVAVAFPLVIVVNLIILSLLTSTYLVRVMAQREYPGLEKKGEFVFVKGLWNTLFSSLIYIIVWFVSLPFWLIPGVQIVLPILLTGWLNRQVCTFDALADYATAEEFKLLKQKNSSLGFILGMVTAGVNYIPMLLFFSPIITMVAFTHLQFESLKRHRESFERKLGS